jgi:AraC-like DNA-binding protein/quercetin dioxygenase-like cupin family protein
MNHSMLIQYFEEYTSSELFYRSCQEHGLGISEILTKLKSPQYRALAPNCCNLPEITKDMQERQIPQLQMNTAVSNGAGRRSVRLVKHDRYAPALLHTHDYFEILYVVQGACIQQIGQQTQQLKQGDLCLLSPAACHSTFARADDILIHILISPRIIEDFFTNALRGRNAVSDFLRNALFLKDYASYLTFQTTGDDELLHQILDMFLEEFQMDEYADGIIASMLKVFFIKLVRKYKRTVKSPAFAPPVYAKTSDILQYIHENYATASLSELSKMLNYSIPYCSKYIKICTGYSFSQIQKRVRAQKAVDYLLHTDMSVERISELVGYTNPENFMRMFKKAYGISPAQYRGRYREEVCIG